MQWNIPVSSDPHVCTEPPFYWATTADKPVALAETGEAPASPVGACPPQSGLLGRRTHWPNFWGEHCSLFFLFLFFFFSPTSKYSLPGWLRQRTESLLPNVQGVWLAENDGPVNRCLWSRRTPARVWVGLALDRDEVEKHNYMATLPFPVFRISLMFLL